MKRLLAGCLVAGALVSAQCAAAADLSLAPLYKAPPPELTQAYNWTGFYFGANGGGGWGHSWWSANATGIDLSGGLVGGTAGYNWQAGKVVFGLEGDLDWSGLSGTHATTGCPLGCSTSDSWLSTVRGRLGYSFDRFMPYVTGGLAVGDIRAATPGFAGGDTDQCRLDRRRRPRSRAAGQLEREGGISPRRSRQHSTAPAAVLCRPTTSRCRRTCFAPA